MFNKPLNRPMFRRGGKAGGGIMTGVERQGYDGTDGQQTVIQNDSTKIENPTFETLACFVTKAEAITTIQISKIGLANSICNQILCLIEGSPA